MKHLLEDFNEIDKKKTTKIIDDLFCNVFFSCFFFIKSFGTLMWILSFMEKWIAILFFIVYLTLFCWLKCPKMQVSMQLSTKWSHTIENNTEILLYIRKPVIPYSADFSLAYPLNCTESTHRTSSPARHSSVATPDPTHRFFPSSSLHPKLLMWRCVTNTIHFSSNTLSSHVSSFYAIIATSTKKNLSY